MDKLALKHKLIKEIATDCNKVVNTINSCVTAEQLMMAINLTRLFKKKYSLKNKNYKILLGEYIHLHYERIDYAINHLNGTIHC